MLRILKVKVLIIKTMHTVNYFRRNNKGNVKLYISKKKYFGHKTVISDYGVTQHSAYFVPRFHDVLCSGEEVRTNIETFIIH